MKIGILMSGGFGITVRGDGRKVQILKQADALQQLGHEVIRLNPWEHNPFETYDAVHVVEGGFGNIPGTFGPVPGIKRMGIAPFIDRNRSDFMYHLSAVIGGMDVRLLTHYGALRRQAAASHVVVARCEDERRILTHGLKIDPAKVKIVMNGVDPPRTVDAGPVLAKFGLEPGFLLHVSLFYQERKNVLRLIEAAGSLDLPLVIGGTPGGPTENQRLYEAAKRFGKIRFLGPLSDEERDALYASCKVFCLPSLVEGTGLVALEAASYGANVVITRNGGPPDYFGNFVEYVNPLDAADIRAAIERAWARPRDGKLREHVLTNLTWRASALALVAAYGFE